MAFKASILSGNNLIRFNRFFTKKFNLFCYLLHLRHFAIKLSIKLLNLKKIQFPNLQAINSYSNSKLKLISYYYVHNAPFTFAISHLQFNQLPELNITWIRASYPVSTPIQIIFEFEHNWDHWVEGESHVNHFRLRRTRGQIEITLDSSHCCFGQEVMMSSVLGSVTLNV